MPGFRAREVATQGLFHMGEEGRAGEPSLAHTENISIPPSSELNVLSVLLLRFMVGPLVLSTVFV